MEKYERRMEGFEAQGNIDIVRTGCGQHTTHRFALVGIETECGTQGYRVTFRTEPCGGHYYEFVGYVREMQVTPECGCCNGEHRIAERTNCADNVNTIWTACREQTCGCARTQQNNAFTYENISREQKNPSLWENWLNRGQNHRQ